MADDCCTVQDGDRVIILDEHRPHFNSTRHYSHWILCRSRSAKLGMVKSCEIQISECISQFHRVSWCSMFYNVLQALNSQKYHDLTTSRCAAYKGPSEGYDSEENLQKIVHGFPSEGRHVTNVTCEFLG